MPAEPLTKRAVTFVDGQNLFHSVREAFGFAHPNYDVRALSQAICQQQGWTLARARFYTGTPNQQDDPFWHHFWMAKLATAQEHVFCTNVHNVSLSNV